MRGNLRLHAAVNEEEAGGGDDEAAGASPCWPGLSRKLGFMRSMQDDRAAGEAGVT